eukprot:IDg3164t1
MANVIPSTPPSPTLDLTIPDTPQRSDVNCALDPSPKTRAAVDLSLRRRRASYSHVKCQPQGTRCRTVGRGGEIGELDELLGMMGEARNDMEKEKKAVAVAQEEREARKVRIGKDLVARSLTRKRSGSEEGTENEEQEINEEEEGPHSSRTKRRKSVRAG